MGLGLSDCLHGFRVESLPNFTCVLLSPFSVLPSDVRGADLGDSGDCRLSARAITRGGGGGGAQGAVGAAPSAPAPRSGSVSSL